MKATKQPYIYPIILQPWSWFGTETRLQNLLTFPLVTIKQPILTFARIICSSTSCLFFGSLFDLRVFVFAWHLSCSSLIRMTQISHLEILSAFSSSCLRLKLSNLDNEATKQKRYLELLTKVLHHLHRSKSRDCGFSECVRSGSKVWHCLRYLTTTNKLIQRKSQTVEPMKYYSANLKGQVFVSNLICFTCYTTLMNENAANSHVIGRMARRI